MRQLHKSFSREKMVRSIHSSREVNDFGDKNSSLSQEFHYHTENKKKCFFWFSGQLFSCSHVSDSQTSLLRFCWKCIEMLIFFVFQSRECEMSRRKKNSRKNFPARKSQVLSKAGNENRRIHRN